MKTGTLACVAGVAVPLILSDPASGGFVGLNTKLKLEARQFGLLTLNLYAVFDNPGADYMISVAGTPAHRLSIDVIGGTFFQHQFGTDKAPSEFGIHVFPDLAFDTFVTIGIKATPPTDQLTLTPTWPGFGPSTLSLTNDSWSVTPINPQGDPFNPAYSAGDGSVLIGQFSTAGGACIGGTMLLAFISDGVSQQQVVSFRCVPAPASFALLGIACVLTSGRRRRKA